MKIDYAITCVDNNPNYLEHLPIVKAAWERLGIKLLVGYIGEGLVESDSFAFARIDSIDSGIQAKITRMWFASIFPGNNIIVDADMIPLHRGVIDCYERAPNDHLVKFGCEHPVFSRHPDVGKWPMHQTAANNSTFLEIVNPSRMSYSEWIEWLTNESFPDGRANIRNGFSGFSDESLLRCLYDRWHGLDSRTTKIARTEVSDGMNSHEVYGRICRLFNPSTEGIDVSKYFEVHGPRPFSEHLHWYQPVIDYINGGRNV